MYEVQLKNSKGIKNLLDMMDFEIAMANNRYGIGDNTNGN